ncbi:MAG: hypothetical protein ACAI35_09900 [Candidatus Methylacidiphilales bacterium]|nr:hypothetical protein [Candidatus Methylacidiphilales bacterium]
MNPEAELTGARSKSYPRGSAPWYRRWTVLLLLALLGSMMGCMALWFVIAEWSEAAFDRYYEEKRAQGYALTRTDFGLRNWEDWHKRRAATPGVRCAALRLCQYGARVAELEPWDAKPYDSERAEKLHACPWDVETLEEQRAEYANQKYAGQLTAETDPARRRRALQDIRNCMIAGHWRRLLAIDCPLSREPAEYDEHPQLVMWYADRNVFNCLLTQYIREGDAEGAISLWEFLYLRSSVPVAVHWTGEARLRWELGQLNFAIRSGLFKEEHLLRMLRAPYISAEELRERRVYLIQRDIAEMKTDADLMRHYRVPWPDINRRDWTTLSPREKFEVIAIQLFPPKASMLFLRNKMRHEEEYMHQIEARRGTSHLDEILYRTDEWEGNWYEISVTDDELFTTVNKLRAADIATHNLHYAVLGFGLHRARTGRIPQKLEEFITPEIQSKLIQTRYLNLTYTIDATSGAAKIECKFDEEKLPPGTIWPAMETGIEVYDPSDAALNFPL